MSLDNRTKRRRFIVVSSVFSLVLKFATPTSIIDRHAPYARDQVGFLIKKEKREDSCGKAKDRETDSRKKKRGAVIENRGGKIKRNSMIVIWSRESSSPVDKGKQEESYRSRIVSLVNYKLFITSTWVVSLTQKHRQNDFFNWRFKRIRFLVRLSAISINSQILFRFTGHFPRRRFNS